MNKKVQVINTPFLPSTLGYLIDGGFGISRGVGIKMSWVENFGKVGQYRRIRAKEGTFKIIFPKIN